MLFSIITVNKDNLDGSKNTFSSLISQSFSAWEWIVIDGASTDGASDWLASLDDKRITWLSETDGGIYPAMNKGIDLAAGDYLHFLNSGDYFSDNLVLEHLSCRLRERSSQPLFIYGDTLEYLPSGDMHYKKARNYKGVQTGMFASHQSMLFNTSLFSNGLHYNEKWKLSADYALICSVVNMLAEGDVLYVDFPISKFLIGGRHYSGRLQGIWEGSKIQKELLNTPFMTRIVLFASQLVWHFIKLLFPWNFHLFFRKILFKKTLTQ